MTNNLRAARLAAGLSQLKLAQHSGVAVRTIISIESGRVCRQDTKRRLLRVLGIPFAEREKVFPSVDSPAPKQ